jgi:2-polyprenyl-3-methyl-5-hydroxy-6-metoxy-1,4-benzoquinol methylase
MHYIETASSDTDRHLPESHVRSLSAIEGGYWWYRARVAWAKRMIREWWLDTSDDAVRYADLGCGTGGFAREIAKTFEMKKVALVDGDSNVLKFVKPFPNAEVHRANFESEWSLPFAPNLITCMDVIEHLKDDVSFLKLAASQLEPGGCLLLSVPAHEIFFSDWDKKLGHFRRYGQKELRTKVAAAGLEVVKAKYMWSFLTPAAPIRLFKHFPEGAPVEFPPVPKVVNSLLLFFSKMEWFLTERVNVPFGTSLMMSAIKP